VLSLEQAVLASPLLSPVLERWDRVGLPDSWLVAGAVAQTFWNSAHNLSATQGIRDVDITYFDGVDLSEESEARHEARLRELFADCLDRFGVKLDVKNEARVHLWYARKFGYPIQPYTSTAHAIATFPTTATAVGVRPAASGLDVCAPFGLEDLVQLVVRPNKVQITEAIYAAKVNRWRAIWPRLNVIQWNDI
jgi:uncharacterized protein